MKCAGRFKFGKSPQQMDKSMRGGGSEAAATSSFGGQRARKGWRKNFDNDRAFNSGAYYLTKIFHPTVINFGLLAAKKAVTFFSNCNFCLSK